MLKRRMSILVAGILMIGMIGCEKITIGSETIIQESTENTESSALSESYSEKENNEMNTENMKFVSVQEFKDYYQIDTQVADDVIEGFIFDYDVTKEIMENDNMWEELSSIIETGEDPNLGYHLTRIRSNGNISNKTIEEFIREANWIYITFDLPNPEQTDYSYRENMVIDFKNKKIYFNSNEDNYRDAELSAELSDSDIEKIYEEFPQSVGDYTGEVEPCLDYSYHVYVIDGNKNQLNFNEYVSDEDNIAFDNYWKNLYKKSFNKEYSKK